MSDLILNNIAPGIDINFFPAPFVFRYHVNSHETFKKNLLPQILSAYERNQNNDSYRWVSQCNSNVITNYEYSDRELYSAEFYSDVIWKPMDALIDFLFQKNSKFMPLINCPSNSHITKIWWNVYQKGAYAIAHDHGLTNLSGIYLLELNEVNTTTFFADDSHPLGGMNSTERKVKETKYAQEGDVLLFPSSLFHYVRPSLSQRTTISFNIFSEFESPI